MCSIDWGIKKWIATETNHSTPIHYNFSYTILHVIKFHPSRTIPAFLLSHRRNTWSRCVFFAKSHTLPSVALPSYHPHIRDEICESILWMSFGINPPFFIDIFTHFLSQTQQNLRFLFLDGSRMNNLITNLLFSNDNIFYSLFYKHTVLVSILFL